MNDKLFALLLDRKILQKDGVPSLREEAKKTGADIEEILIKRGIVSDIDLAKLKGELFGLPFINLEEMELSSEVVSIIPQAVAENYELILFEKKEKQVKVALVDPSDYRAIEAIDFWAKKEGYTLTFYITSPAGYRSALRSYTVFKKEVKEALDVLEQRTKKETKRERLIEVIKKAPVAKIVELMIQEAVDAGTSDIHIEPGEPETRVRFRIDGVLRVYLTIPASHHPAIVARIKVLADLKIDETRIPQDGRIRMQVHGQDVNLRVSTLPVLENEKVVMRILPTSTEVFTLEALGFWQRPLEDLKKVIARPSGVMLVSGPTGSGKSTTLYSILSELNKESTNITTLEDPVEYFLRGVNQVQINTAVGLTFANGLRAVLRQDPNIVMVGEIRDTETAELATHAALTGHFMLSTIHAKDVPGVIPRLIDMHVEPFLIAASLNTILAQRLVRKLCPTCRRAVIIPDDLEKEFRKEIAAIPEVSRDMLSEIPFDEKQLTLYRVGGVDCQDCGGSGYRGRTVVTEVIGMTQELQDILSHPFGVETIAKEMVRQGKLTMKQDVILKALKGITSPEEVLRITRE